MLENVYETICVEIPAHGGRIFLWSEVKKHYSESFKEYYYHLYVIMGFGCIVHCSDSVFFLLCDRLARKWWKRAKSIFRNSHEIMTK